MNKKMTINDIPKMPLTVCENVTFVEPIYTSIKPSRYRRDSQVENCIFRNCKFKKFSINSFISEVVNCVFENCTFDFKAVSTSFVRCEFLNCIFPDGLKSAFGVWTTFSGCNYDDSFLESLSKDMVCPTSGKFIGWKKAYLCKRFDDSLATKMYPVIVKLLIPSESRRSSALSNKCRCEKAMVLEVQDMNGCKIDIPENYFVASIFEFELGSACMSIEDQLVILRYINTEDEPPCMMRFLKTKYVPGEMVYVDSFNTEPLVTCSEGIHFFMTREEACEYIFS